MRILDRILVALLAGIVSFTILFLTQPPAPKYFPLEHAWHWAQPGDGPGMGWYGRSGFALAAAGIACGIATAVTRRRQFISKNPFSTKTIWALSTIAMAILVILVAAIVWEQIHWFAKPAHALDSLKIRIDPAATNDFDAH